jgi:hypothetical protein
MWVVAGVVVGIVAIVAAVIVVLRRRRTGAPAAGEPVEAVHHLDEALRSVETLTDAKGSSLLDQPDRSGRTIRDRLASGEAHLHELRQPDDTSPLLRRVLDEVAGEADDADEAPETPGSPLPPPA